MTAATRASTLTTTHHLHNEDTSTVANGVAYVGGNDERLQACAYGFTASNSSIQTTASSTPEMLASRDAIARRRVCEERVPGAQGYGESCTYCTFVWGASGK